MLDKDRGHDTNRDPITGEPGSHPLGTGTGAATAGAAGAAIGAVVGGPVGAVVGAAVGAIAGGAAGHNVAEAVNPTTEEAYWRENYKTRPYVKSDTNYDEYSPAYRYGWESRVQYGKRNWDEVESDLERGWENAKGTTKIKWEQAKMATRDAWDRVTDGAEPVSQDEYERRRRVTEDSRKF